MTKLPFFRTINSDGILDAERWYVTNFSKEQIERQMSDMEEEIFTLKSRLDELQKITDTMDKTLELVSHFTQSLNNLIAHDEMNYHPDDDIDYHNCMSRIKQLM